MAKNNPLGISLPDDDVTPKKRGRSTDKNKVDRRKQSLYLAESILDEALAIAAKLNRPLSWVFQTSFNLAKDQLNQMPVSGDDENE